MESESRQSQLNETPGTPAAARLFLEQKAGAITFQRNDRGKETLKIDSTAEIEVNDANSKTKVSMKPTPDKTGLFITRIYTFPEGKTGVVAAKNQEHGLYLVIKKY